MVPFCPFYFRVPVWIVGKKGTLIIMGILRNLVKNYVAKLTSANLGSTYEMAFVQNSLVANVCMDIRSTVQQAAEEETLITYNPKPQNPLNPEPLNPKP